MTLDKLSQYGPEFQTKIIASLLTDKEFASQVRHITMPSYFDSKSHTWIVEKAVEYFDRYNSCITMGVLKVEVAKIKQEVLRTAILQQLKKCYSTSDDDKDYIQKEFISFVRNQAIKEALLKSVDDLNSADYDGIRTKLEYALNVGKEKDSHHDYAKEVESRHGEDNRNPIPFPWEEFNTITQGGAGAGDLVIFFGNPGGGKSWIMTSIAIHAAKLGYNVAFYTLELSDNYVAKRIDTCLTGIPSELLSDSENQKILKKEVDKLKGQIKVKEFLPKRASIDVVRNHVRYLKDTEGFEADMIIIDYLDYLKPSTIVNKMDGKAMIDDSYIGAKGLAKELQVPVISPSQVNRAGAKDDVIEGDKAAGSYDKIMIGDIVYSLSRKKEDKVNNTGRFHQIKNRYGPDGITWHAHVDTSVGIIKILSEGESENTHEGQDYSTIDKSKKLARDILRGMSDKQSASVLEEAQ